jgi:preprotein translocase subunit SecE
MTTTIIVIVVVAIGFLYLIGMCGAFSLEDEDPEEDG